MHISNNNIGMATLLQNNKTFVKTLVNGVVGGNNIIVSNVGGNVTTPLLTGAVNNAPTVKTIGNVVMPNQSGQTILLTNNATGSSSILSYQQYQQLLQQQQQHQQQQQQQQQQTRLIMPQEMVSLPLGSILQTSNGGLAVISSSNVATTMPVNASTCNTPTQGTFIIAASAATSTNNMLNRNTYITTTSNVNGFQQQFLQQVATPPQQQQQQQQTATSLVSTIPATTTRYFSQFSQQHQQQQQQQTATIITNNNNNNNNINKGQTRTVYISRATNATTTPRSAAAAATTTRLSQPLNIKKIKPITTTAASAATTTNANLLTGKTVLVTNPTNNVPKNVNVLLNSNNKNITIPALQKIQPQQPQQQPQSSLSINKINQNKKIVIGNRTTTTTSATTTNMHPPTSTTIVGNQNIKPTTTTPTTNHVIMNGIKSTTNGTATESSFINNKNTSTSNNNKSAAPQTTESAAKPTSSTIDTDKPPTVKVEAANADTEAEAEPEPEIDIVINNVVCSFSVRCHLNLREIALKGCNVEYRRENGMVTMKLRRPYTTASIWSSGRITCTGATSEDQAKIAARRYARCLNNLGFPVRFQNFRVVNVLGTCSMPFAIKIVNFSEKYKKEASYEPELHPGVTYKLRYPKATLKIFSTGSITITAASVSNVQAAVEHIFPLVFEFRKQRSPEELEQLRLKQLHNANALEIIEADEKEAESGTLGAKRQVKKRCGEVILENKCKKVRQVADVLNEDVLGAVDDPEELVDDLIEEVNDADDLILYDPNDLIEGPEETD